MRSTCFAPLVALALALAGCLPEGSGGADDLTPPYDDDDLVVPDDDDIGDLDDDDTPSPDDDDAAGMSLDLPQQAQDRSQDGAPTSR